MQNRGEQPLGQRQILASLLTQPALTVRQTASALSVPCCKQLAAYICFRMPRDLYVQPAFTRAETQAALIPPRAKKPKELAFTPVKQRVREKQVSAWAFQWFGDLWMSAGMHFHCTTGPT